MSTTLILYLELNFFGILLLTLMFLNYGKTAAGLTSADHKLFKLMLVVVFAIIVFDTGMWVIDGRVFPFCIELNYFVSTVYYLLNPVACLIWLIYCDYMAYPDSDGTKKRYFLYCIPTVVNAVHALLTPMKGLLFFIDEQNVYHRGPFFFITMSMCLLYFLYGFIMCLRLDSSRASKHNSDISKFLVVFPLFPLCGAIIQNLYYGISIIWISTVFALLLLFINVQNTRISTDGLTQLYNRRYLELFLEREIKNTKPGSLLFMISIDVDRFKSINDQFGHSVGDEALRNVAEIIRKSCDKKRDFMSRPGGDEFVIVGRRKNTQDIQALVDTLHLTTKRQMEELLPCYRLSLSVGFAIFGENNINDVDSFMNITDKQMYKVKEAKKQAF